TVCKPSHRRTMIRFACCKVSAYAIEPKHHIGRITCLIWYDETNNTCSIIGKGYLHSPVVFQRHEVCGLSRNLMLELISFWQLVKVHLFFLIGCCLNKASIKSLYHVKLPATAPLKG